MFAHLFSFLNNRLSSTTNFNSCSIFMFISNSSAQVYLIDFRVTVVSGNIIRVHSNAFRPVSQRICSGLRICSGGTYTLAELFWFSRKSADSFRVLCFDRNLSIEHWRWLKICMFSYLLLPAFRLHMIATGAAWAQA